MADVGCRNTSNQVPASEHRVGRARFPGQHARCWYCGRVCVWGANGVSENLMCSGSREWRCWNSIGFCGLSAASAVTRALRGELERLEGFDDQFRRLVDDAERRGGADATRRCAELDRATALLAAKRANLSDAIAEYGPRPAHRTAPASGHD